MPVLRFLCQFKFTGSIRQVGKRDTLKQSKIITKMSAPDILMHTYCAPSLPWRQWGSDWSLHAEIARRSWPGSVNHTLLPIAAGLLLGGRGKDERGALMLHTSIANMLEAMVAVDRPVMEPSEAIEIRVSASQLHFTPAQVSSPAFSLGLMQANSGSAGDLRCCMSLP